jgi:tRNA dimethylallyltransferase
MRRSRPELLVIVGPTASGKTDLALKVAKTHGGEIISADSWTVYRGFDVGTAKSTITQQKAVKHHLIDVREATDGFNAPMFKELALKAIADIQKRGKLPILVGGTGLYIDSVLYDFGFLPDSHERQALDNLTLQELLSLAIERKIDMTDIDSRNKRRVIRAIEAKGQKPTKGELRSGTLIVGLSVSNDELRRRIEKRTDRMIEAGLEQEVKALAGKYGWEAEPMKGVGYRQWREYFEDSQTLDETKARIVSATMGLAKRQRTWFKRSPDIQWFDSTQKAMVFLSGQLK